MSATKLSVHFIQSSPYVRTRQRWTKLQHTDCYQTNNKRRIINAKPCITLTHAYAYRHSYSNLIILGGFQQNNNDGDNNNKYVRLRGLAYIHTCRSYVHTPRDFTNGASLAWCLRWRISTVMFTSRWTWPARWPIRSILGFLGSKVHKNERLPAQDADEPPRKVWRR